MSLVKNPGYAKRAMFINRLCKDFFELNSDGKRRKPHFG
jgi:hypothetical protein